MAQSAPDLIGRLAVHYRLISMQQLSAATQEQSRAPEKKLGAILVELGFISSDQLTQLLEAQRRYLAQQAQKAPQVSRQAGRGHSGPTQPLASHAPGRTGGASSGPQRPPPPPPQPDTSQTPPPPKKTRTERPRDPARVDWLHKVLSRACDLNASDVLLHARAPVKIRVHGALVDMAREPIHPTEAEALLVPLLNDWQREVFFDEGQVDFSYEVAGLGRFRVNVYNERSGCCGVFHFIPSSPPSLSDLGLPSTVARVVNHHNGIVLITGPAGSGKTSTMAALVDLINEERSDHVLSIEDPVEYVHKSKRCIVNQRQVNRHTKTFAAALRSGLRADPDVICIGELRDLETISLALSAAETGHLVLGTLHTLGAVRTLNRVIGAYPPAQQSQVRIMLSESLRAIISQQLLPRADRTGVALAYELLFVNHATSNMIRENRTYQIANVLQMGRTKGMCSLDDSLLDLVERGIIDRSVALLHAQDRRNFERKR